MKAILQKCHNQWLLNLGNSDNLLTFAPKAKCSICLRVQKCAFTDFKTWSHYYKEVKRL